MAKFNVEKYDITPNKIAWNRYQRQELIKKYVTFDKKHNFLPLEKFLTEESIERLHDLAKSFEKKEKNPTHLDINIDSTEIGA